MEKPVRIGDFKGGAVTVGNDYHEILKCGYTKKLVGATLDASRKLVLFFVHARTSVTPEEAQKVVTQWRIDEGITDDERGGISSVAAKHFSVRGIDVTYTIGNDYKAILAGGLNKKLIGTAISPSKKLVLVFVSVTAQVGSTDLHYIVTDLVDSRVIGETQLIGVSHPERT